MALRPKNMAQLSPSAGLDTLLYAVPTASTIIAKLHIVNRGNSTDTVRVAKRVAGAADDVSQYRVYDWPLAARDFFELTIVAEATDVVYVRSTVGLTTFTLEGLLRS